MECCYKDSSKKNKKGKVKTKMIEKGKKKERVVLEFSCRAASVRF